MINTFFTDSTRRPEEIKKRHPSIRFTAIGTFGDYVLRRSSVSLLIAAVLSSWFGLLLEVSTVAGQHPDIRENAKEARKIDDDGGEVVVILSLLKAMPDWTELDIDNDLPKRATIEAFVRQIGTYKLDSIRQAMATYQKANRLDMAVAGKLLVINHFLFDFPETVRRDSRHFRFFGGWHGQSVSGDPRQPKNSDRLNIRWPWSMDSHGEWRLTGTFGGYNGPPYKALLEFDYDQTAFGKRKN